MEKTKFTPKVTLVAQLPAGIESEVIVSDGVMYLPMMVLPVTGSRSEKIPASVGGTKKPTLAPKEEVEEKTEVALEAGVPSEEELEEMETSELMELIETLGFIDDLPTEGKNTKRKLINFLNSKRGSEVSEEKTEEVSETVEEKEETEDEGTLVPWNKLKKGQEVTVYWSNFDDKFNGTVHDFDAKKTPIILYEDGDKEIIDPKVHTKIWVRTV